ncbi:MAG: DNA primase [Muribaculaceae bacterium]|nr:DNA primase [Muribaculaceae bacterium]
MIDRQTVDKIKSVADIVEVVSDYVHLVRRGGNYMGLCPFHNERTPSFSVNKRRNFCYCFSCHKGGSPVNFIMEKEGVSYHDALLHLAKKYGIKVEERELSEKERAEITRRESMYVANQWAMEEMQRQMRNTEEGQTVGLQYFYNRGITEEAIKEFKLGYVLNSGNHLTDNARKAGHDISVFKELGLTGVSGKGNEYDKFYGRVMYPIMNSAGKVIAFGGRDLKGGPAKYINSPESEIYTKSNELYGIYQAKNSIVRQDKCFLVEGYMDVIGMWQAGMKNVVASSGTALTDGQISLIHRFTKNITILYDGDSAGIKAALRGIDMLLSHKMKVNVLLLPDGKDPDEFAREHTPEEFRKYVEENETDIIRFKCDILLKNSYDNPRKKSEAIMSVVESISHIPEEVERNLYIQQCAILFNVDENIVALEVGKRRSLIEEQLQAERRKKHERRRIESENDITSYAQPEPTPESQPVRANTGESVFPKSGLSTEEGIESGRIENIFKRDNPLAPLERKVIENCIRYGFMEICRYVDENNAECSLTVAQYIEEELVADDLYLTDPLYSKILKIIPGYYTLYRQDLANFTKKIEDEQREERRRVYEEIARKGLGMAEIERAEKKLEERLTLEKEETLKEYSRDYVGNVLASHEDNEVRRFVNEVINDRYILSRIYQKNEIAQNNVVDFNTLVPRSLAELKEQVLNTRMQELQEKLKAVVSDQGNDTSAITEIMKEMRVLQRMRAEFAKNIGERILDPRNVKIISRR